MTTSKPVVEEKKDSPGIVGLLVGLAIVLALAFLARWLKFQVYDVKDIGLGIPGKAWSIRCGLP